MSAHDVTNLINEDVNGNERDVNFESSDGNEMTFGEYEMICHSFNSVIDSAAITPLFKCICADHERPLTQYLTHKQTNKHLHTLSSASDI